MMKLTKLMVSCISLCMMQYAFAADTNNTPATTPSTPTTTNATTPAANNNSPIGYWKTIDDVSGQPKSILQIWLSPNQTLFGRVVKVYPDPGKDENEVCALCQGSKHNQRILGMVIMENLSQNKDNPNEWSGGEILDPRSGQTYHINLKVLEDGQKLNARGYIGLPLFGRTQTWVRVSGPSS